MKFKQYVFDFEVYPQWWCVVFEDLDGETVEITSDTEDYVSKLKEVTKGNLLIGFNIKNYDLRILNAIVSGASVSAVHNTSMAIIDKGIDPYNNYYFWNKFSFTDLYDDWRFGSLKAFESNIGMSIVECSVPFDKVELSYEDKQNILKYNRYDVKATKRLLEYRKGYVNSKRVLSEMFDIPLSQAYKSTNAKLSAIILGAKKINRVVDTKFIIPKSVEPYIRNNLPEDVVDLFNELNDDDYNVRLFNNDVVFGSGGIHSVYGLNIYSKTDDEYILRNIDVRSYYPNLIMLFDYMSRNVKDKSLYKVIYDLRVKYKNESREELKLNGRTEKYYQLDERQEALKLILNTTYGAMKNQYNALFDWYQGTSLCYLGQLLLAALANKIYTELGVMIVQTNTDGILIKMRREDEDKVMNIVAEWEELTGFIMEHDDLEVFLQRDVNNYIEVINGRVTLKGKWSNQAMGRTIDELNGKSMLSNLNAIVAHRAVLDYYIKEIPIEQTVNECDDIFQFCFTTRTGWTYDKTYHYYDDNPVKVNGVNRVVATTDNKFGTLKKYKVDENGKVRLDKIAEIPDNCRLLNDELEMIDDLDKDWYVNFATNKLKELVKI